MKFFHLLFLLLLWPCLAVSLSVGRGRPLASPSSSSLSLSTSSTAATTGLASVSLQRTAILDGSEWASVQSILLKSSMSSSTTLTSAGAMRIVTGTSIDSDVRVVGVEAPMSSDTSFATSVYQNSMAEIPPNVKDEVAITTMVASLCPVHCAIWNRENEQKVNTKEEDNRKVIVVGGSAYACFVARGLAAMGLDVSLISTGNPTVDDYRVMSYNPAVGEMQVGFCNHVGEFSVLVDTVSDESNLALETPMDDDEDDDYDDWRLGRSYSGVLALLKSRHKCSTYLSTMTASQQMVRDNGVLFGPGQVKDYVQQLTKAMTQGTVSSSSRDTRSTQSIIPPKGFGATVQKLLKEGVTYSFKYDGSTILRTWSLPEFWELTSWPRDSAGANVRFGFPVIDDINIVAQEVDEEDDDDIQVELDTKTASGNPFITEISGVKGLSQEIIEKEKDCLLFLSAKYCRTCKTLAPAYTRYARMNQADNLIFGQADTTGSVGKELGRILGVNSVPLFVLFRNGQRFGTPLTVNKLPSKKLDYALQLLKSGSDWDSKAIDDLRERSEKQ